jgi:hypothetical protein
MSISKAKKARQKLAQQGRVTPDVMRGSWQGVNPTIKRTPTLQEKQAKLNKKHRRNHASYSDGSFCIYKRQQRRATARQTLLLDGCPSFDCARRCYIRNVPITMETPMMTERRS